MDNPSSGLQENPQNTASQSSGSFGPPNSSSLNQGVSQTNPNQSTQSYNTLGKEAPPLSAPPPSAATPAPGSIFGGGQEAPAEPSQPMAQAQPNTAGGNIPVIQTAPQHETDFSNISGPEPQPPETSEPVAEANTQAPAESVIKHRPKPHFALRFSKKFVGAVIIFTLGLIGGFILKAGSSTPEEVVIPANASYQVKSIDLNQLDVDEENAVPLGFSKTVTINGQLQANNSLIITPGSTPSNPRTGQIYYDEALSELRIYDGTAFTSLADQGEAGPQGPPGPAGADGEDAPNAAPLDASYLLLGSNSELTNERIIAGGSNINLIDGGSNANMLISVNPDPSFNSLTLTSGGASGLLNTTATGNQTYTFPDTSGEVTLLGQTIGNSELENNAVSFGGVTVALGGNDPTPAFNLVDSTNLPIVGGTTGTLSVGRGGTGNISFTSNGVLLGNGASPVTATSAPTSGQVLLGNGSGVPTFTTVNGDLAIDGSGLATIQENSVELGNDTIGDYVESIGSLVGLSTTGNSGEGSNPTLSVIYGSVANSSVQGNTSVTCASGAGNLTGGGNVITLGDGGACADLNIVNNPNFTTSVTTPVVNLGTASSATGELNLFNSASLNKGTLQVAALGQDTVYTLPDPGTDANICLSTGNCAGAGSGVTTSGGTTNRLAKFTAAQNIEDSSISDDGSTVTLNGSNLAVQGGSVTAGTTTQAGSLVLNDGSSNTGSLQTAALGSNRTYTFPDADGEVSLLGQTIGTDEIEDDAVTNDKIANNFVTYTAGNGLTDAGTVFLGGSAPINIGAGNGIQVNANDIEVLYGSINGTAVEGSTTLVCPSGTGNLTGGGDSITLGAGGTCSDLNTVNNPTFSTSVTTPLVTNASANLQLTTTTSGNIVLDSAGTIELQDSTNLTGSLVATGNATFDGGSITVGADSQAGTFTIYDGGTGAGSHTGIFQVASGLGQNTTYTFPDPGQATASVCLTTGNCAGAGSGVTTSGGTTNRLAKFTASQNVEDSSISDDGSTVTLNGSNLTVQGGTATIGTSAQAGSLVLNDGSSNTGSLQTAALGSNRTYTFPDADGEVSLLGQTIGTSEIEDSAVTNVKLANDSVTFSAGNGLADGGTVALGGSATFNIGAGNGVQVNANDIEVLYGSINGTAAEGSTAIDVNTTGNLTGGAIGTAGGGLSVTLNTVGNPVFNTSVTTPLVTNSGSMTLQTQATASADDLIFQTAGTETARLTEGGGLTLGTTSTAGTITLHEGTGASDHTGLFQLDTLSANRTYTLPDNDGTICTTAGNCAGAGSGVTTSGGTTNRLAKFTAAQNIEDSSISDDGSTVTLNGSNLTVQGGSVTAGTTTQAGSLILHDGSSNTGTIQLAGHAVNRVYTVPEASGNDDFCLKALQNCVGGPAGGAPAAAQYLVLTLDGDLTAERRIVIGTNLQANDAGGNGDYTISTVDNPTFSTSVTTPLVQNAGLTLSATGANNLLLQTNGSTRVTVQSDGDVDFDSNTLFVDAGNNRVGVGTATPSLPLSVGAPTSAGVIQNVAVFGQNNTTDPTTGQGGRIYLGANLNTGRLAAIEAVVSSGLNGHHLAFLTNANGATATEKLRITSAGNVGIGTTNPANFKLQSAGHVGPNTASTYDLGSATTPWRALYADTVDAGTISGGFSQGSVLFANSAGELAQDNANFFWDDTNNRLGIGTSSPDKAIDIEGTKGEVILRGTNISSSISSTITLDAAQDYRGRGLVFSADDNSNNWFAGVPYTGAGFTIGYHGTQPEYKANSSFFINTSGNIGIGTTNPTGILHVDAGGTAPNNGDLRVNGRIAAGERDNVAGTFSTLAYSFSEGRGWGYNDQDNAVFYNAAGSTPFVAEAGTSNSLYINSNGNVGINTIPTQKLQVAGGNVLLDNTRDLMWKDSGGTGQVILQLHSDNMTYLDGPSGSIFRTAGAERIRITSGGNVGINNSSPAAPLSFANSEGSKISLWDGTNDRYGFGIANAELQIYSGAANPASHISFGKHDETTFTEWARINGSGNVGIGTTNPANFKLQAAGHVGPNTASTYDLGSPTIPWRALYADTVDADTISGGFSQGSVLFANSAGELAQDNANFFWDDTNNRLGIGTNSLDQKLEVAGAIEVDASSGYRVGGAASTYIGRLHNNGSGVLRLEADGSRDISIRSTSNESIYVEGSNGNVGVGTSSPDSNEKLHVAGNIRSDGRVIQSGYSAADAATDNMIMNGDFEFGNLSGWSGLDGVSTDAYSGNYSGHAVGPSTVLSDDYVPVDPDRDVLQLEGYFKKNVNGTTPGRIYFGYIAYDENKTAITTSPCGTYCYFAAANYTFPDNDWHKFSATTTGEGTSFPNFPVGTKYVRVLVLINYQGSSDTETVMDHVTLKRINHGPLFVGNNFSSSNMVDQHQVSKLFTTNNNDFIIQPASNGNVGIGTSSPEEKLHLQDGTLWVKTAGGDNQTNIKLGVFEDVSTTALYEISTDDVGLDRFNLHSNRWSGDYLFSRGSNDGDQNIAQITGGDGGHSFDLFDGTTSTIDVKLNTNGDSYFNGGDVGIGIASPDSILHVKGAGAKLKLQDSNALGDPHIDFFDGSGNRLALIDIVETAGEARFYGGTGMALSLGSNNNTDRLLIDTSGNVGIGDTSPAALLTVGSGDAFQINTSGAIATATGITSSGTITFSSLTNCDTLDTDGSGNLSCGTDAGAGSVTGSGTSGQVTFWDSASTVAGSNNLFWDSGNSRLGIGTNSPTALLSITNTESDAANPDGATGIVLDRAYSNVGDYQDIVFGSGNGDAANRTAIIRALASGAGEGSLVFFTQTGAGDAINNEVVRIQGNGNVGIGTTSPDTNLVVQGGGSGFARIGPACGSNYTAIMLNGLDTSCSQYSLLGGDNHTYLNSNGGTVYIRENNNTIAQFDDGGTFNGQLLASGKWYRTQGDAGWFSQTYGGGIYMVDSTWVRTYNSKSFYSPANIRGDGGLYFNSGNRLDDPGGDYGTVGVHGGGKNGWEGYSISDRYVFMSDTSERFGLYNDIDNIWALLYDRSSYVRIYEPDGGCCLFTGINSGDVGINETSPKERLHVNGSLAFTQTNTASSDLCYATGSSPTRYVIRRCSSLRSLKENINDLDIGFETVMKLQPRIFNWKGDDPNSEHSLNNGGELDFGFIAEEVEAVNPLLAEYSEGKLVGVKYRHLTALLTKAFQDFTGVVDISNAPLGSQAILVDNAGDVTINNTLIAEDLNVSGEAEIENLTVKDTLETKTLIVTGKAQFDGPEISFSNNIRGVNVSVAGSATDVLFETPHADSNYAVQCTPSWDSTCFVTDKTPEGFKINYGSSPPADGKVDWFVVR